jgi:hypothetical protein
MRHRFIEEREDAISQVAEAFVVPSAAMTEALALPITPVSVLVWFVPEGARAQRTLKSHWAEDGQQL